MGQLAMVRATISSLNAHKSSMLPPPRQTSSTSHSSCGGSGYRLRDFGTGTFALYQRRIQNDLNMRHTTAQCRHVAQCGCLRAGDDAYGFGNTGSGRLRSGSNKPS
jgi:hypothetical protein